MGGIYETFLKHLCVKVLVKKHTHGPLLYYTHQDALEIPFKVTITQLYHMLIVRNERGLESPGMALLDWVQVRLVEFLRRSMNTIMSQGIMVPFPVAGNAMNWPELARQLLVVQHVQNLMQLR